MKATCLSVAALALLGAGLTIVASTAAPPKSPRTDRYGDPLPPEVLLRLGTERFRHGSGINVMSLSPDRKLLATAGKSVIRIWDTATGRLRLSRLDVPVPEGIGAGMSVIAFAPDSKTLLYGDQQGGPRLLDTETGNEKIIDIPRPDFGSYTVAWSPDGRFLAVATQTNAVILLNARTHKALWRWSDGGFLVVFSPDSRSLVLQKPDDAGVVVYDVLSRKETHRFAQSGNFFQATFSPDSKLLAVCGGDGVASLWSLPSGTKLRDLTQPEARPVGCSVTAATFSPDGRLLATGSSDHGTGAGPQHGTVRIWDIGTGKVLRTFDPAAKAITGLAFLNERTLLATDWPGNIHRWDVATGAEINAVEGEIHHDHVAWSPDGRMLASGGRDGIIRLSDAHTGRPLRDLSHHGAGIVCLAFDPTNKSLGTADGSKTVTLWDVASGPETLQLSSAGAIDSLVFSPSGEALAATDRSHTLVHIWNPRTGKECRQLRADDVNHVAFIEDASVLVGVSSSGGLTFWDWREGKRQRVVHGGADAYSGLLAAAPAARMLAFGAPHSEIRIWDIASARLAGDLEDRDGPLRQRRSLGVMSMALSRDGRWLLTGGFDRRMRLWEIATRQELHCFTGQGGWVTDIAFGPSGRTAVSCGKDANALVWDLWSQPAATPFDSERLWHDLGAGQHDGAYNTLSQLVTHPDETVRLLAAKLQLAVPVEREQLRVQLERLDSRSFSERAAAGKELARLGSLIEGDLHEVLRTSKSPEVRQHVGDLLASLRPDAAPALQEDRALAVLELIATPKAHQTLEALARRAPAARRTQRAKEALKRLARGEER